MFGVLQPLPILSTTWENISIVFVVGLPECGGFEAIWVVVDRLSKMRYFISCHTKIDIPGVAEWFLKELVHIHGLPATIALDWGP